MPGFATLVPLSTIDDTRLSTHDSRLTTHDLPMNYAIGVLGATGQVGREFLRILDEGDRPDLPIGRLRLFASERSAGKRITVRGEEIVVERAEPSVDLFKGLDFVLSAIGDAEAKTYSPIIAQAGPLNVDKSN